jgi:hypothetical protein
MNQSKKLPHQYNVMEKGYRPIGTLNSKTPPQGGSAVPVPLNQSDVPKALVERPETK